MSAAPQPLILVVEDDAAVCTVLCTFLEDIQHRVAIANELSTGAKILEESGSYSVDYRYYVTGWRWEGFSEIGTRKKYSGLADERSTLRA